MRIKKNLILPSMLLFALAGCTSTSKSQGNPIPVTYRVAIEPKDSRTGVGNTAMRFRATITELPREDNIYLSSSGMNITWSIENAPGYDVGSIETIKMPGTSIDGYGFYRAPMALPAGVESVTVTIKFTFTLAVGLAPQSTTTTLKIENVVYSVAGEGTP